jgi:hypothetical protein
MRDKTVFYLKTLSAALTVVAGLAAFGVFYTILQNLAYAPRPMRH